ALKEQLTEVFASLFEDYGKDFDQAQQNDLLTKYANLALANYKGEEVIHILGSYDRESVKLVMQLTTGKSEKEVQALIKNCDIEAALKNPQASEFVPFTFSAM